MKSEFKRLTSAAGILIAAMAFGACAEKVHTTEGGSSGGTVVDEGLSPTSPDIVYADGWDNLVLDANGATTKVDTVGHYKTDKNMCQRPGDGAFDLKTWNELSKLMNQAVKAGTLTTPRCWDSPNGSRFYNRGIAEIALPRAGKRQIFEYKNAQVCTSIADTELSDKLFEAIEKTIQLADRADATDCPNYRP